MKTVNFVRIIFNLITLIPLAIFSVANLTMIDKMLMGYLFLLVVILKWVPFLNIIIELAICNWNSKYSMSSIGIIMANIIVFILNLNVGSFIGGMF